LEFRRYKAVDGVCLTMTELKLAEEFGATHTINSRATDIVEGVRRITGSTVDFAFDCTGVIPVIEKLAETVGMLGTLVLIGGAPAGARFHSITLRRCGVSV